MKKILSIIIVITMALIALSGCKKGESTASEPSSSAPSSSEPSSSETEKNTSPVESCKTLGDAFNLSGENNQIALYEDKCVYAFEYEDTIYRVIAASTPEIFQEHSNIDFMDDDYDQKQKDLLAPLTIEKYENLSEQFPTQEELDSLIGKTGKELLDNGWYITGYEYESMEFYFYHGPFAYTVVFDGKIEMTDDFNEDEAVAPLKVKSVTFTGIGDATNIE
ncbi:MAG: hypothetical protein IJL87_02480 [Clostridia bacterium]|nr:hypothetical protein [Clostridia bacterium]